MSVVIITLIALYIYTQDIVFQTTAPLPASVDPDIHMTTFSFHVNITDIMSKHRRSASGLSEEVNTIVLNTTGTALSPNLHK